MSAFRKSVQASPHSLWPEDPFGLKPIDPHIVIKFDKGRLVPGTPPMVHPNATLAEAEASRLAAQFPGTEYCVFRHVSSLVTESAPVRVLRYPE